jgi:succinoglycan biosynthesis transport protein ExoP
MSRVSDAMRRAGRLGDERASARADDMPFISGEDTIDDPIVDLSPLAEIESPRAAPTLSPRVRQTPSSTEASRGDAAADVRILDVLRVLYQRRWLMAAVIALSLASAATYNYLATPFYEARARLLLEPNSPDVVPFRPVTEDQGRLDYFVTQLEVLRSRGLARKTLEDLELLSPDPTRQPGQISQLLGGLSVSPVTSEMGESRVVNVTMRSADPALAARLANGLAQTYVAQNLDGRRQGSRDASEWLKQRMIELRHEVDASERALQQYREQKGSVSLGDQQNIVVQKLAQLSAAVTSARTERLAKQTLYEQLTAMKESDAPLDTFSPILSNPFIQGLKAELATLQRERRQLSAQLGELHPEMIRVNSAISNAERRLNEEMAKVVEGVQNEYRAARSNEEGLTAALEEQKREVLNLNQQSIAFGSLQRDAASTQQLFETVRQRVKETELSGELQSNNAKILDAAEVPRSPIWPRKQLNLLIALLGGGFVAFGLALGLEHLNPRIAKPADIADALGLPLLGVAPRIRGLKNRPTSPGAVSAAYEEALRIIRTRIFLSPMASAARSMAVTSTNPGEGQTMVASNLALSMAMAGRRVLLIDADLRRPQLHSIFDVPRSPGLSDVLADDSRPGDALIPLSTPGLSLLTSGSEVASSTDVLDSERLRHLIDVFSQVFDVIVLDCPPVLAVADASIIASASSSVLFVVSCGHTSRDAAQLAIDRITSVQAQVVGVVLNNAKVDPRSEYGYTAYLSSDDTKRSAPALPTRKRVAEHA